jgi:hypothetical protein
VLTDLRVRQPRRFASRASRYRKPSPASGAEVATAYFVDSSALVKRYVVETGTAWVRGITRRRLSTHIYLSLITAVEVTSAVARRRGVTISAARASSILSRFPSNAYGMRSRAKIKCPEAGPTSFANR